MRKTILCLSLVFVSIYFILGCGGGESTKDQSNSNVFQQKPAPKVEKKDKNSGSPKKGNVKITFIELGSVNCVPCRMMQPVMKSVEKKYGNQLEVIFYDVWQPDQRHYAQKYSIRVIPTQVFLNSNEKEIFRHEGFFPEDELNEFLQSKGLVVQQRSQGN